MSDGHNVQEGIVRVRHRVLDKAIRDICEKGGLPYQHSFNDVIQVILDYAGITSSHEIVSLFDMHYSDK